MIEKVEDIDTSIDLGKLLVAAIAKMAIDGKSENEIIIELYKLKAKLFTKI